MGDGELNEGQCWEAFEFIAAHRLSNCIVFIDNNKKQLDGRCEDILYPFDYTEKMKAFGFMAQCVNGQDAEALDRAIQRAKDNKTSANAIVLDTIKGAGIPYFEHAEMNHSMKWNNDEINAATDEAIAGFDQRIAALAFELNGQSKACPCSGDDDTQARACTARIQCDEGGDA